MKFDVFLASFHQLPSPDLFRFIPSTLFSLFSEKFVFKIHRQAAVVMKDQAAIEGELASLDDSDEYRSLEGKDEDTEL